MSELIERFKKTAYPEEMNSRIIKFHMFGIESIDEQLDNYGWALAHQEFNGMSIPSLISSELYYQPATADYKCETIIGTVIADTPLQWRQLSVIDILADFKKYIDDHYESLFTFKRLPDDKCLEVYDENGTCIGEIGGNRNRSEVTMYVDIELEKPDDKIEYYNSVKQSVELWGFVHDFIAHSGEADGLIMRFMDGDPQHEIYIGGAQPSPTPIEMDLVVMLEDIHRFNSELPAPRLGDIDFQEVEDYASILDAHNVIAALKQVIAENRTFYRYTKHPQPISTADLLYAMSQQGELRHQSLDENNHHD